MKLVHYFSSAAHHLKYMMQSHFSFIIAKIPATAKIYSIKDAQHSGLKKLNQPNKKYPIYITTTQINSNSA